MWPNDLSGNLTNLTNRLQDEFVRTKKLQNLYQNILCLCTEYCILVIFAILLYNTMHWSTFLRSAKWINSWGVKICVICKSNHLYSNNVTETIWYKIMDLTITWLINLVQSSERSLEYPSIYQMKKPQTILSYNINHKST